MRKRVILYSDIIIFRYDLLRQLKKANSKKNDSALKWEQLINSCDLHEICGINHNYKNTQVIKALANSNLGMNIAEATALMGKLHRFIENLDHGSYETWKGHCRKVRSREGKRTLTVEHSILEKVCTYLETTHQTTFDPHTIGKNEFQEAIETLLNDANNCKKNTKNQPVKKLKINYFI